MRREEPAITPLGLHRACGVVVLGMGRSGTSSVTRMFDNAGFYLGEPEDLMAGDQTNPTGYFENLKVWRANEQVLNQCQRTWFDAPTDTEQLSVDPETRQDLKCVLDELLTCASRRPLALKDPRIGILMTLWWPLLLGVLHPVLVLRDPVEVAQSLQRRDGTALPVALAMWEINLTRTLDRIDGYDATVIPYRAIIENSELAGGLVADAAQHLRPELASCIAPALAASALEPKLHRNHTSALGNTHWLTPRQRDLWRLLESMAPGTLTLGPPTWAKRASDEALMLARYENRRQRAYFELVARLEAAGRHISNSEQILRDKEQTIVEQRDQLDAALLQLEAHRAGEGRGAQTA